MSDAQNGALGGGAEEAAAAGGGGGEAEAEAEAAAAVEEGEAGGAAAPEAPAAEVEGEGEEEAKELEAIGAVAGDVAEAQSQEAEGAGEEDQAPEEEEEGGEEQEEEPGEASAEAAEAEAEGPEEPAAAAPGGAAETPEEEAAGAPAADAEGGEASAAAAAEEASAADGAAEAVGDAEAEAGEEAAEGFEPGADGSDGLEPGAPPEDEEPAQAEVPDENAPSEEQKEPAPAAEAAAEAEAAAAAAAAPAEPEEPAAEAAAAQPKTVGRRPSKELIGDLVKRRINTVEAQQPHDDADAKEQAESEKWQMAPDFFYEPDAPELATELGPNELPREAARPTRFLGFDFDRHYNLTWVSHEEFAYVTGHVICFVNIQTGEQRCMYGKDDGGVGAIAMSPDMNYLAVGEKSTTGSPNVYIYTAKDDRLYRILRKGAERGYASVEFSPHNKGHLAALGCAPDFLLSIWDWRNERLLLKCKAYGQDIFSVRWGQFPGMLITAGTGHIRFWKMALTFTGLKLQGDIGKFGATELSDIVGLVELPDGKIVTGSEYGKLLLWEGVFVKVELVRYDREAQNKNGGNPHSGSIEVIFVDADSECVVSGGDDGYLRWWPISDIDVAEADYDNGNLEYAIEMQQEVRIPPVDDEELAHNNWAPAYIQHVVVNEAGNLWLIQDVRNGAIWQYDKNQGACVILVHAHSKQITGTLLFDQYPGLVISSGMDGSLRAFNASLERDNELFMDRRESGGVTCLVSIPDVVDAERRSLCCGFSDGTIRAFHVCRNGFALIQAVKPHSCMVSQISYSPDGGFLATMGVDNTIFFFEIRGLEDHAVPVGFIQIHCKVNHFAWRLGGGRLLLGLEDGSLVEVVAPVPQVVDSTETYLVEVDYRALIPELPEVVEEDEEEEEDGDEAEEGEAEAGEAGGARGSAAAEALTGGDLAPEEGGRRRRKKKVEVEKEAVDADGEQAQEEPAASMISRVCYVSDPQGDAAYFVGTGRYSGGLWEIPLGPGAITACTETPLGSHTPAPSMCQLHTKLPVGVAVTFMAASPSGRFLFLGFADGRAWVIAFANMSVYCSISLADCNGGAINSIAADGSESLLMIGAGDGSLSAVTFNSDELHAALEAMAAGHAVDPEEVVEKLEELMPEMPEGDSDLWEIPDVENNRKGLTTLDITDPQSYSIQEEKLKTEEDNAKTHAERQKSRVRERVASVREELQELMQKNSAEAAGRLADKDMIIDQDYIRHLREDMECKVEDVRKELAWSVEFHERGMQKLKDYFLSNIDFERIEVLGFKSPHRVATFRCPAMSAELQESLAKLHELISSVDGKGSESKNEDGREEDDEEGDLQGGSDLDAANPVERAATNMSSKTGGSAFLAGSDSGGGSVNRSMKAAMTSGAEQREARRQNRQARRQQMLELEKAKPSDSYEDPLDVEAIAHAEATLGNYMLKTSDQYQVPENQRMNAEKKRRQMFLLEESMHAIKTEFNQKVLSLRDFRQQVRGEIQRDLAALQELDQQLGTTSEWAQSLLEEEPGAPREFPERRFEYTEADLQAFKRQLQEKEGEPVREQDADADAAAEKLLAAGEEERAQDEDEEEDEEDGEAQDEGEEMVGEAPVDVQAGSKVASTKRRKKAAQHGSGGAAAAQPIAGRAALQSRRLARLAMRAQLLQEQGQAAGALGRAVLEEEKLRLRHEKAQLEEHIKQVVDTFNNTVASIEKEKAKLESDLKNADMKLLVLYEELLTLNELEEKDEALLCKANKCRQDKMSIMHQIKDCQDQLGDKKTEIEQWHNEEQNLQAEFTELVGENSPFLGALLKIYKKKVKRSKRKKGLGDDDDFDEDEDEDEEESDLESDDDEDDDEDVGPPPGCDVQIYESVIDLREKRLDMEDALQEIQKAVEDLKRTHKKLLDEERRIDKEQKQTDTEIQQFQSDKQRKLNQVEIVFALRLSQVQCLEGAGEGGDFDASRGRLPPVLDHHIVFTKEGLNRLMSRITELHQEGREVKGGHKQLQRDFRLRKKDKSLVMQHIEDLQAKYQEIQMLKFGQTVDLDLIERSAPNKWVQELEEKAREAEQEHRQRLDRWEKRIEQQKRDLTKTTQENTSLMEQIVSMGYSQMQLDAALNARIANVTVNDNEPLIELREIEREKLKDLLAMQAKEIQTLQAEINLFRKKGGHIYTTVTATKALENGNGGYPSS